MCTKRNPARWPGECRNEKIRSSWRRRGNSCCDVADELYVLYLEGLDVTSVVY